jgi:hypothetical protein
MILGTHYGGRPVGQGARENLTGMDKCAIYEPDRSHPELYRFVGAVKGMHHKLLLGPVGEVMHQGQHICRRACFPSGGDKPAPRKLQGCRHQGSLCLPYTGNSAYLGKRKVQIRAVQKRQKG